MYNNALFRNLKFIPTPAGVDKLQVYTRDFQLRNTLNFSLLPNYKNQGEEDIKPTPLCRLYDSDGLAGEILEGSKAFHNAGDQFGNLAANIDYRGLSVNWNPSKLAGKYTGELASPEEVKESLPKIESYLSDIGVRLNLSECKISRIDLAKDREMEDKVFSYSPAFSVLEGKRMKERVQYPDGVRIGKGTRQGIFYDKGLELKPKSGSTNNMRGEVRLLKGKSVQRVLSVLKLSEFTSLHQEDISNIYSNYINKDIFRLGNSDQLSFDFASEVRFLKSFRESGRRNAFKYWIMTEGMEVKLLKLGGTEGLRRVLEEAGFTPRYVHDCLRECREILSQKSFQDSDTKTLSQRYEEIRYKFTA